ncbi:hypothetical protein Clacol_002297 [Clathrus columnatus]|uniref:Uncharacterized protein n=1 Tax=Clathrus columnatus TaxID=1419009 RepID=A0AAV5A4B5_9AGAM|nr:hypothetical protein Clacol_002297 [Clathrus columnatus]
MSTDSATIPVVPDQSRRRAAADGEEFNPNAPAGSEQLISEDFTAEDEQEEITYERPDANKISRASVDDLKDGVTGGGATIKPKLRGVRKDFYKQERDMDREVERAQ